jgi:uncharacterized protein (TIGR02246 family)
MTVIPLPNQIKLLNTKRMKTPLKLKSLISTFIVAVMLTLPLLISAQSDNKSEISPEMREKIDQLNNQFIDAMQKGDLSKIMDLYTDDATLMLPGGKSLKGKKEIAAYLEGVKNIKNVKLDVTDAGGSGKIIYQVGKATYVTNVNGAEKQETNDFVMVLKRQSDWDYKISVNSTN